MCGSQQNNKFPSAAQAPSDTVRFCFAMHDMHKRTMLRSVSWPPDLGGWVSALTWPQKNSWLSSPSPSPSSPQKNYASLTSWVPRRLIFWRLFNSESQQFPPKILCKCPKLKANVKNTSWTPDTRLKYARTHSRASAKFFDSNLPTPSRRIFLWEGSPPHAGETLTWNTAVPESHSTQWREWTNYQHWKWEFLRTKSQM